MLPDFSAGEISIRRYRRVERPLAFIGFLLFFVGLRFFLDDEAAQRATAVGHSSAGTLVPTIWSAFFIIGGFGVMYGTQRPDPRIERAAHILCFGAVALNAAALFVLSHSVIATVALIPHVLLLAVFAERIRVLTRLDNAAARLMERKR